MTLILILLGAIFGVGALLKIFDSASKSKSSSEPVSDEQHTDTAEQEECCGMHITCEKDSLLSAVSQTIEYYDDEELDRFAGRQPDTYDDDETEEFRTVLLTMPADNIAGWARSLQLRNIELPAAVRDELLLIVAEARDRRKVHS